MAPVTIGRFVILFRKAIDHEIYEDGEFFGVKIFTETHCFDVIDNPYLGPRLLITHRCEYGHLRDMPFHLGTAAFLPEGISVTVS